MQDNPQEPEQVPDPVDVEKNKLNAVLSYIGILILVPLLNEEAKKSPFAMFHMNQGLVLLIAGTVGSAVFWIPFIGWAAGIAVLILWIMGVIGAINGEMKPLPIIGDIKLIK